MTYRWCFSFFEAAYLCIFLSACSLVTTTGTHTKESPIAMAILSTEFVYVGTISVQGGVATAHGTQAAPPPTRYQVGQQYIFHHRAGVDNDQLFDVLQKALRAKGIPVLEATRDAYRYIGGLAFQIRMQDQGYDLRMFNTLDNKIVTDDALAREWSVDDYILVVENAEHGA
jgi:hypothetical protein